MLQLLTSNLDIVRISKLLIKYNLKATIKSTSITILGPISEELANQLYANCQINAICNFDNSETDFFSKERKICQSEEQSKTLEKPNQTEILPTQREVKYNPSDEEEHYVLRYPTVKRGEIYLCDFGKTLGHEQGGKRYVIIIQNDVGNKYSPNTIVLPCTTAHSSRMATQYSFYYSDENMLDYPHSMVSSRENTALGEAITTVSKSRLIEYKGQMTEKFMDEKIQPIIEASLALKHRVKTVKVTQREVVKIPETKIVYIEKNQEKSETNGLVYKDLNLVQVQLLSFVDINQLIAISKSLSTDEEKARKILELFGFDFDKMGVPYLWKAICISPKEKYFNMETLSKKVAESSILYVRSEEVQRLIVARIKERFKVRKSPAIDFIRLVNIFLIKREDNDETGF